MITIAGGINSVTALSPPSITFYSRFSGNYSYVGEVTFANSINPNSPTFKLLWSNNFNDQARSLLLSAGATVTVYQDGVGSRIINSFTNNSQTAQTYTLSAFDASAFILSNVAFAEPKTLTISSREGKVTVDGAISNLAGLEINSKSASSLLSGVISGSSTLNFNTAAGYANANSAFAVLTLSGANSFTGNTTINGGKLTVTGSLSDISAVTVASTATYNLAANDTIASISGAGNVTLNSNTLTLAGNSDTTFSGVMSGTGGLVKDGTANFTMAGANTYNGGTTINAGTLTLGANNVLADTGEVNVSSGTLDIATFNDTVGTVTLSSGTITGTTGQLTSANFNVTNATGTTNIAAILAGSGQLTKTGAGVVTLSAANTFTGDATINAGTLILTGSLASATDVVMINAAIWDLQAAQTIASLTMATGNSITITAGTSSLVVTGLSILANSITTTGIQTYTGAVTLAANTAINTTDSAVTFSAGITGTGNSLTVNAGSGAINTAALGTSAASLGAVILNSTGATTLGGTTYAASITTNAGGTVAINTGTVTTTGAQTYNDDLELFRTTVLQSIEDA